MAQTPSPSARPARTLPTRPNLEHLRNEAKQHLKVLRQRNPQAKLTTAQLAVARDYGFASWRQLKAHVDTIDGRGGASALNREHVFEAARTGDVETVRRAFEAGFDPGTTDHDGRSVHQIAKQSGTRRSSSSPATSRSAIRARPQWSGRSAPSSPPPSKAAPTSSLACSTPIPS